MTKPHPPKKPVVVFVPALVATPEVYRPLLERLTDGYDIRSVHWPKRLPDPLTDAYLMAQVDRVAKGLTNFALVGQSLAAPVVFHYAARNRVRISQVVAVAPVLFPFHRLQRTKVQKAKNIYAALRSGLGRHLVRSTKEMRRRMEPRRLRIINQWGAGIDLLPWLGKLPPTTILWHRHEEVIPLGQLEEMQREFPQIAVTKIPGSHLSLVLQAGKCAPYLKEALRG